MFIMSYMVFIDFQRCFNDLYVLKLRETRWAEPPLQSDELKWAKRIPVFGYTILSKTSWAEPPLESDELYSDLNELNECFMIF